MQMDGLLPSSSVSTEFTQHSKHRFTGPTNGARTLAAFAGNFQRNVGYAPPPPQEEAQAPQSPGAAGGLREVSSTFYATLQCCE